MEKVKPPILVLLFFLSFILLYLIYQGIKCIKAIKNGRKHLESYGSKTLDSSYGKITYVDKGKGEAILSIHGLFGGYDQAYDTAKDFVSKYRIIAPSRFGYPGSDIKGEGRPKDQVEAYIELLDRLGIEKVFLLSTSAGGSVAFRFALDYPERTKGLILYSSSMPYLEKPERVMKYIGPPKFLISDYPMFLLSPFFKAIMGMPSSTIYSMVPVRERKMGVYIDGSITNLDMARNYDDYKVEDIKRPILILQAKDDKLALYQSLLDGVKRLRNYRLVVFEDGGHLMEGKEEEVKKAVFDFIDENGLL